MTSLVAINPIAHRGHYVQPDVALAHGAQQQLIPVVPSEFSFVATQLPLVLTKHEHTGEFGIAALTGFTPGENLMFGLGAGVGVAAATPSWQGLYVPLQLQRQPFFLGHDEQGGAALCIDSQSPSVGVLTGPNQPLPHGAERLFQADGNASSYLAHVGELIKEILAGEAQRRQLLELLLRFQLVQPLALDLTFANGQSLRLQGLYSVDAQKLAQLPAEHLVALHQAGHLPAVYAIVQSMSQIYHLIHLKNQQLEQAA